MKRRSFENSFKFKVALESFQRDTTLKEVQRKYNVGGTQIQSWRRIFREHGPSIYDVKKRQKKGKVSLHESPEQLKEVIAEQAVEIEILKKALTSLD